MTALIVSVLLLLFAPLLARSVKTRPGIRAGFDGFVLITVIGLVTLTLLPEAMAHGGILALLIAALGLSIPWISELLFHKAEAMTHRIVLMVASLALIVHAATDGALIAFANEASDGTFIQLGILLHRAGIAITLWWLFRSMLSSMTGLLLLGALGMTTVLGYFFFNSVSEAYSLPMFGYWQAFAAGSLLHIVLHPLGHADTAGNQDIIRKGGRVGTAAGLVFISMLIITHYIEHTPHSDTFPHVAHHTIDLLVEVGVFTAPLLMLGVLLALGISKSRYKEWRPALRGAMSYVPWTLIAWFGMSILAEMMPDLMPLGRGSFLLFAVWLAIIVGTLMYQGARVFFGGVFAPFHRHSHGHAHSKG
ncbi:hypothetical protein GCM10017044_02860 [Kordiimonas sediminis]|uniref:Uncharacterized protein n=1 Tax=Kordiimonas sediminis TaxID=1735581 RepID=A0A919AKV7_9PROT|nr:hypothetical protein [Kordiimonas sediminis]GHF12346.1 hypothetical protein GCM10017044_02860 [Kordiimonas sediminis]